MTSAKKKDLVGFLESDGDSGGVHVVAAESEVFQQHNKVLTRTFLANHSDPSKYLIHMLLFDNSLNYYESMNLSKSVIFYDYFNKRLASLGRFYEEFKRNHNPNLRNILVIDKLNLFNCYASSSSLQANLRKFFKCMRKYTHKIFTLINVNPATANELKAAYDNADVIAVLMDMLPAQQAHFAQIIKNRADAKPSVNNVLFNIVNEEVKQINDDSFKRGAPAPDFDMASLTTFKLTLNESEKESKNKLHLPYFDAQRKEASLDDEAKKGNIDEDDFDEEDEEV